LQARARGKNGQFITNNAQGTRRSPEHSAFRRHASNGKTGVLRGFVLRCFPGMRRSGQICLSSANGAKSAGTGHSSGPDGHRARRRGTEVFSVTVSRLWVDGPVWAASAVGHTRNVNKSQKRVIVRQPRAMAKFVVGAFVQTLRRDIPGAEACKISIGCCGVGWYFWQGAPNQSERYALRKVAEENWRPSSTPRGRLLCNGSCPGSDSNIAGSPLLLQQVLQSRRCPHPTDRAETRGPCTKARALSKALHPDLVFSSVGGKMPSAAAKQYGAVRACASVKPKPN